MIGLWYNGTRYLFSKNIQGDITSIHSDSGDIVARYTYDAYGNHQVLTSGGLIDTSQSSIGNINPFRYRGYYYDVETGLYYLNSRYYDPRVGRFISIDILSILDQTMMDSNGLNLYMYCGDNPVMNIDITGSSWESFWNGVGNWFQDHWVELVIGVAFIVVGALVAALTAGTGVGFMAAFGSALLSSMTQVGISMAISVGLGGLVSLSNGGGFFDNVGDNLASGFMWGGIFAGGAQILSGGFKAYATIANKFKKLTAIRHSPIFSPDRLKKASEIAKIAKKGQAIYNTGGRLISFGFGGIDVGTKALLHMHLWFMDKIHIPLGTIIAGIIGGFKNEEV